MAEAVQIFFAFIGFLVVVVAIGAAFTLGAAAMCRLLKWNPVSTVTNIYYRSIDDVSGSSTEGDHG